MPSDYSPPPQPGPKGDTGTLEDRWEDFRIPITSVKLGGSKDPGFSVFKKNAGGTSQGVFVYWFDKAQEEEVYFVCQLPHAWKGDDVLSPHVHWIPATTGAAGQVVQWGLEYSFAEIGSAFSTTVTILTTSTIPSDDPVVADTHYKAIFPDIDLTGITSLSSMLVCRLFRNATVDTYDDDAGLLEFDLHIVHDDLGSVAEYDKDGV